jgi:hypothetical protein
MIYNKMAIVTWFDSTAVSGLLGRKKAHNQGNSSQMTSVGEAMTLSSKRRDMSEPSVPETISQKIKSLDNRSISFTI